MLIKAILIGLVTFLSYGTYMVGSLNWIRPIVCGSFVGLVLGDPYTGCIVGATLELAFLGSYSIGGALPPDFTAGTILATAFVIASGADAKTALALAFPAAALALLLKNVIYIGIRGTCSVKTEKYAAEANVKKVKLMHIIASLSHPVIMAVVLGVCYYIGANKVSAFLNMVPHFITNGLVAASNILPALGFAMLAKMLLNKSTAHYFILGFLISAYLKLPVLGIALFAVVMAIIIVNVSTSNKNNGKEATVDEEF